ncbi:MAG TPA: biotin/lipoyl-containing protein, partial [Gemmatimonadales bacterium]
MATKVLMEALSPTMEEGRLVEWKKNEGDQVASGDVLAEVETDKAVMELVARSGGTLLKQAAASGATVPVGSVIGWIGEPGETIGDGAASAAPSPGADRRTAGQAASEGKAEPPSVPPAPAPTPPAGPPPRSPVRPPEGRVKASPLAR